MAKGDIYTPEQLRAKHSNYFAELDNQASTSNSSSPDVMRDSFIEDYIQGGAKSVGNTVLNTGRLVGRNVQKFLSKGADKVLGTEGIGLGENSVFDEGTAANARASELVERNTPGEKVGGFVTDVAQFAIPGTAATKATQGVNFATKAATLGGIDAGVTVAQQGEVDEAAAINFFLGAAGPVASKGLDLVGAKKALTQKIPEWLVEPLLKQAKDAKIKRSSLPQFLVSTGRVGNVDDLVKKTVSAIDDISGKVKSGLKQGTDSGVTVKRDDIMTKIVDEVNEAGGAIDLESMKGVVNRLAPQAQGILKKEVLGLDEANRLRSLIDKTLGDRGFLRDQLPFDKDLLRSFTNTLREEVKDRGPKELRGLFDDYAKNIRLRDALLDRANSGSRTNNIGLSDLIAGGVGFGTSGPLGAALGVAGRRSVESAQFKTRVASALAGGKLERFLDGANPQTKAVLLEMVESIENSTDRE